jgi:hypothetical protein
MKFVLMLVGAALTGALATVAVPPILVGPATDGLRQLVSSSGLTQIHLTELNPLRAIYDYEQQQIRTGMTPEQLGLHSSAITLSPMKLGPPQTLKLDLSRAFEAQAESQIDQSIRHSQTMQAYTNNPSAWSGPPPN